MAATRTKTEEAAEKALNAYESKVRAMTKWWTSMRLSDEIKRLQKIENGLLEILKSRQATESAQEDADHLRCVKDFMTKTNLQDVQTLRNHL